MSYSDKLLNYRKSNQISQSELAKRLQVQQHQISAWESGRRIPGIFNQNKIDRLIEPTIFEKILQ